MKKMLNVIIIIIIVLVVNQINFTKKNNKIKEKTIDKQIQKWYN